MASRIPPSGRLGQLLQLAAPATAPVRPAPPVALDREAYLPPKRPNANFIPSADQILALVTRAQAALARGIYWDRGTIINVLL